MIGKSTFKDGTNNDLIHPNNRRGISLIVLVITIIVMIILASVIILSLNNSGIIERASEATSKHNLAQVKTMANIGYAEGIAEGLYADSELTDYTKNYLEKAGVDFSDFGVTVVRGKVIVTENKNAWVRDGFTVKRGDQVLNIGDVIDYDVALPDGDEWRVVGVGEAGELLITTLKIQKPGAIKLGSATDFEKAKQDFTNAIEILDNACNEYGNSNKALYVRSMRADDINVLTEYTKGVPSADWDYTGKSNEYGNLVTFTQETPAKIIGNGTNGASVEYSGENTHEANGFTYFNFATNEFITLKGTNYNGKQLATVKSDMYIYRPKSLPNWDATEAYPNTTLFYGVTAENTGRYWLADRYTNIDIDHISYGVKIVSLDKFNYPIVGNNSFIRSKGTGKEFSLGIKPVVAIDPIVDVSKVG